MNHPQQIPSSNPDSIERVSINSVSPRLFHHEFQRQNKPVILTDAFNDKIPVDVEKITSFVGDMEVSVRVYGPERFSTPKVEWKNYCEMRKMSVNVCWM